jgi:putative oxidoreductase
MKYVVLPGRIFFSFIFIRSGLFHFTGQGVQYAMSKNVPLASISVPLAGVLAVLGGLLIALGYKPKTGALLIVLFLVPVTLMMHNFWAIEDPMQKQMQTTMFMKNLSMLGGAMLIMYFGSGPLSLETYIHGCKPEAKT